MYVCMYVYMYVIQEEGSYVHNMYNIVEKHLSVSIASVRSRGGSLVIFNGNRLCLACHDFNFEVFSLHWQAN
jgi:hypothetical protein